MVDGNSRTDAGLKHWILQQAAELGFVRARIASAGPVGRFERFEQWLGDGLHAGMAYMARGVQVRRDPSRLMEGARSVICLAASYAPPGTGADAPAGQGGGAGDGPIARFARGRDYHRVLKGRCHKLMDAIRQRRPDFVGRALVDAGPIAERSLAAGCGLGWIGDNGCLFVPDAGSYVVLCEIVCNLPLLPDGPIPSGCTHCGLCRRACPTGALLEGGLVDCRRCRSCLSIEHAGRIDPSLWPAMGGVLFGCDACQWACPHNQHLPAGDAALTGADGKAGMVANIADVLAWEYDDWDAFTRGRALRRRDYLGWLRNAVLSAGAGAYNQPPEHGAALALGLARLQQRPGIAEKFADELDWALSRLRQVSQGVAAP
jgi:epoxyqueuosine reductase